MSIRFYKFNKLLCMKRKLLVPDEHIAIKLMKSLLSANMIDNDLEVDDPNKEHPTYFIKLVWLSRDPENNEWVGCPCFICDFKGMLPDSDKPVHGIVYVKIFASQTSNMTKMHIIEDYFDYDFTLIEDGDEFKMHDEEGRFEDEIFVFTEGVIIPKKA